MCATIKPNRDAVILKPGKEKAVRNRHHWIFSGAVASYPSFEAGDLLPVVSHDGQHLGYGYFNKQSSIVGRLLSFDDTPPLTALQQGIERAFALRQAFFDSSTNAYRLVNGEGDCLPGLIVDKYHESLVMQLTTLGMDRLKTHIVDLLLKLLKPASIYEKSTGPSRKEEGLREAQAPVYGPAPAEIPILENGLRFLVTVQEGQKTGFFLDHRAMRQRIRSLSANKRVLNCFSYTGGFSVYAAAGGASAVTSVDISDKAIAYAVKNMALNGYGDLHKAHAADVFTFLREHALNNYDLVILDPPAFAKRKKDVIQACRGYKDINRVAMQKMPPRSLLLTSSCSYFVDEPLFQKVVFQAAVEAGRTVKIIGRHDLAVDHPVNLCHPEGDYLKSLLLYID